MLRRVTDFIRRSAFTLVDTGPRVAERNKVNIEGDPITESSPVEVPVDGPVEHEEGTHRGPGAPMKPGSPTKPTRPTAGPLQRAPRAQPASANKWNTDTIRQLNREYQREYRGTGQVNQRKTQTGGA
jgi:hypothetical protein